MSVLGTPLTHTHSPHTPLEGVNASRAGGVCAHETEEFTFTFTATGDGPPTAERSAHAQKRSSQLRAAGRMVVTIGTSTYIEINRAGRYPANYTTGIAGEGLFMTSKVIEDRMRALNQLTTAVVIARAALTEQQKTLHDRGGLHDPRARQEMSIASNKADRTWEDLETAVLLFPRETGLTAERLKLMEATKPAVGHRQDAAAEALAFMSAAEIPTEQRQKPAKTGSPAAAAMAFMAAK